MSNSLKSDIKQYMESIGAVCEGHTGGDHVKYTLPNGQPYYTGLTPSDNRVLRNIKSDVRRILGLTSEGGKKAATYSKATEVSGYSTEAAKREQRSNAAIREVVGRCTAAIIRIDSLLIEAQRNRDHKTGERLVAQYLANKETLERYFQPVPALTCKSAVAVAA